MRAWRWTGFCALLAAACGKVTFAPAPWAPVAEELAYSPDEDLTRLRWSVDENAPVTFELLTAADFDFHPVDFDKAPYPSGQYPCGGGRKCYQLVLRGRVLPPPDKVMIRSRSQDYGAFKGVPVVDLGEVGPAIKFAADLSQDARSFDLTVSDWLDAVGLERTFRLTVWPEPEAECTPHGELPDGATTLAPTAVTLPFDQPLTDAGRYCARVRPVPRDGGPQSAATATVLTAPDVFRGEKDYQPPFEESPIVWRLVYDLEASTADRCTALHDALHSTFATALAGTGAKVHELTAVELAPGCMQSPGRAIDSGPLADEAKQYSLANYPNKYFGPLLVYVDNLAGPLPSSLLLSVETYAMSFVAPQFVGLVWAMINGSGMIKWNETMQYVVPEDPQFTTTIHNTIDTDLPLRSQLHDNALVMPLMDDVSVAMGSGDPWKVCQASPSITRYAGLQPIAPSVLTPTVDPQAPPGFSVVLPLKILIPKSQFMRDTVVVRYEICRRWCDHPFRSEGGAKLGPWLTTPGCVRNEAP